MHVRDKALVWLAGEVKTPPFSDPGRRKAGWLLRRLQRDEALSLPDSRPMPGIGARCHELRVVDSKARKTWRIVYRLDADAVVIVEVFAKKTHKTPRMVLDNARRRLRQYDDAVQE